MAEAVPFSALSRCSPVPFSAHALQRALFAVFPAATNQAVADTILEEGKAGWVLSKPVARCVTHWSGAHAALPALQSRGHDDARGDAAAAGRDCGLRRRLRQLRCSPAGRHGPPALWRWSEVFTHGRGSGSALGRWRIGSVGYRSQRSLCRGEGGLACMVNGLCKSSSSVEL